MRIKEQEIRLTLQGHDAAAAAAADDDIYIYIYSWLHDCVSAVCFGLSGKFEPSRCIHFTFRIFRIIFVRFSIYIIFVSKFVTFDGLTV